MVHKDIIVVYAGSKSAARRRVDNIQVFQQKTASTAEPVIPDKLQHTRNVCRTYVILTAAGSKADLCVELDTAIAIIIADILNVGQSQKSHQRICGIVVAVTKHCIYERGYTEVFTII